ncbi:YitT family protein [Streptomyces sp. NPDC017979]|uniref:membrane protein YczE n=1 Tax=Streptomyces sp. NPDC017979 TaxID=3365024 RepID=UPI0037B32A44
MSEESIAPTAPGRTAPPARASAAAAVPSRRLPRRLAQLYAGLVLYGISAAMMVRAGLGLDPWGVFHQGLAERTGLTIGVVTTIAGVLVLLAWIPLRQRPGLGTVSNVLVIGFAMDATLYFLPAARGLAVQIPALVAAVVLNGAATGLYIAARFGPGPRDGLMTGLHRVTGRSIRLVRTGIEVAVVASGVLLGGTVGVGTIAYALGIGPLAQAFLRIFAVPGAGPEAGSDEAPESRVVARGRAAAGAPDAEAGAGGAILRQ